MPNNRSKIKQLARQIKNNPGDSFSKFALALEFRKKSEFKKARILFEDIYNSDPEYVGVYYHLGKLYEDVDNQEEALKIYEEGMKVARKQQKNRTLSELKEALEQLKIELYK